MDSKAKISSKILNERLSYIAKYLLLTAVVSFIGWLYEVLLVRIKYGTWTDRGFLYLPFCPIYGCTLLFIYFFMGTPKEKRGILKNIQNPILHTALYLFFAFLIPTVSELSIGALFDRGFHVSLWSYAGMAMNFHGYITLPISLLWSVMIYTFMRLFFHPLKNLLFRIPNSMAISAAAVLFTAVLVDFSVQFYRI